MSFWNNPENASLKMLVIGAVVIGAGAFAYHAINTGGDTGRVISTPVAAPVVTPKNAMMTVCAPHDPCGNGMYFCDYPDCSCHNNGDSKCNAYNVNANSAPAAVPASLAPSASK